MDHRSQGGNNTGGNYSPRAEVEGKEMRRQHMLWVGAGLGLPEPLRSKAPDVAKAFDGVGGAVKAFQRMMLPGESLFLYCNMLSIKAIFLSQDLLGQHVMSS